MTVYKTRSNDRSAYCQPGSTFRGEKLNISVEDLELWDTLKYYPADASDEAGSRGFHTDVSGLAVFKAIYKYCEAKGIEPQLGSNEYWKLKFTYEEEADEIASDSEDDEEDKAAVAEQ